MLLYSRAGVTREVLSQGDFCVLVDYTAAKAVLDVALSDFESWNVSFLATKLREKVVAKNSKEFIEAGFFLRCLLEYYRIERSNRYRYISKLCSDFHDKNGLRFDSFMTVVSKFTELATETKLQLYRDCYCLTKGVITPESIFTVCSEQLVFLKHLKMKSFYRLPKIIHKPLKQHNPYRGQQPPALHPSSVQQIIWYTPSNSVCSPLTPISTTSSSASSRSSTPPMA
jgi:hypothetical protein